MLAELDALQAPTYHMLGNHCLYNLPRDVLNQHLKLGRAATGAVSSSSSSGPCTGQPSSTSHPSTSSSSSSSDPSCSSHPSSDAVSYYAFSPHPSFRIIVLDSYDVSALGWPAGHPLHEQAMATLTANNPNAEKNDPSGLVGVARRFVKFGGGVSNAQLAWLRCQLEEAAQLVGVHTPDATTSLLLGA